jgi:hypothetical protein
MIKISPLGMISIAILVKRWNGSENTERKGFVRSLLQSGNELQIHLGLQDLFKIADEQFKTIGLYSAEACPTEMLKSIYTNGVSLLKDYGKESFDGSDLTGLILEAKREIALHFCNMFKADHFEQLPMPEFGHEMPDPGDEGTAEGAIAAAKVIVKHLPKELKLTIPPQQPEDGITFGSFPESHKLS